MSETPDPGVRTTEGLFSLGGQLTTLTSAFTSTDWRVSLGSILAYTTIICIYIWSRTKVKTA